MKNKFMVGLVLGLLMLCVATGVHAGTAAFSINSVNFYGNSYTIPQSAGFVFTPQSDIVVSSLGFFDYLGDGLGESHKVGIFDSTGTLLSCAVVSAGTNSQWVDDFRYTDIAPLTLKAGHSYTIAALFLTRADIVGYADVADAQFNPAISVSSVPARYILNTEAEALEFPTETEKLSSEFWYGPNFKIANATSNANLIDLTYGEGAGSFELGNFVDGDGIGYMAVAPGDSTTITGWTVGGPGDGVDWLVEPFANADTGFHSVDLQHMYSSSISTTIPTITGNDYLLSFSAAVGINVPGSLPSAEGMVSAGSLVNETFTTEISDHYATQSYLQFTYLFTATDDITTIVFQGTGPSGSPSYYGPVIDSVSVTDDISELFPSGTGSLGNTIQTASTYNFSLVQDTQATCSIYLFNPGNEDQIVSLEVLNAHSELDFSFQSQDLITVDSKSLQTIPVFIDATNAPAGVYDVLLKISTENGETLYSNLCVTIVEEGTQGLPDLSISSQDIQVSDYTLGESATLKAVIHNKGLSPASNVQVQFYELDNLLGETVLNEVPAEGIGTASITAPITTSGEHLIRVVLDFSNAIEELDENNNEGSKIIKLGDAVPIPGNILVTGSLPSTVYTDHLFTISGRAVYDIYVDGVRYTNYVVKGGSVQITLKGDGGTEWIYGGVHTNVDGYFSKTMQAPADPGSYKIIMTVTDNTFIGKRELVLSVTECPATPPLPPSPPTSSGIGTWTYLPSSGTWNWTWTTPPVNEPTPESDLRVFSENIHFSTSNPALDEEITVFTEILYWATSTDLVARDVPVNFYVTYPGTPKMKIGETMINSISVGAPDFGSRYVYTTWKNRAQGIYIVEVEIDPNYVEENQLNNAATRAIIVGQIQSFSGVISGQVTDPWGGVGNVMIELYDSSGTSLLENQLTSDTGYYLFENVPVDDYQVHIVKPVNYLVDAETKVAIVSDQSVNVVNFHLRKQNPPVADAGDNLTLLSDAQDGTVLYGQASDLDDDPLTYRWLEGDQVLKDWTSVGTNGEAWLDLSVAPDFLPGAHELTLEVSDGIYSPNPTDSMILAINNSPPYVIFSGGGTYQLNTEVQLDGNAGDYDGDDLQYRCFERITDELGNTVENTYCSGTLASVYGGNPVSIPTCLIPACSLEVGEHNFVLEVTDSVNEPVEGETLVKVIDTSAPTLSPVANTSILWPPNHKMVDVIIDANAVDNSGEPVVLSATVSSSEPPDALGDGTTMPDFTEPVINQTTGTISLQLRAERAGGGTGRTYEITITATDQSDNFSTATVSILAPHDMGRDK